MLQSFGLMRVRSKVVRCLIEALNCVLEMLGSLGKILDMPFKLRRVGSTNIVNYGLNRKLDNSMSYGGILMPRMVMRCLACV